MAKVTVTVTDGDEKLMTLSCETSRRISAEQLAYEIGFVIADDREGWTTSGKIGDETLRPTNKKRLRAGRIRAVMALQNS